LLPNDQCRLIPSLKAFNPGGGVLSRPNYPSHDAYSEFFHLELGISHAVELVVWKPTTPVQAARWGRLLVWKIFGGNIEVRRTPRHGMFYPRGARDIQLDIVTMDNWIIEVKTGKSQFHFRQVERSTRARVEGKF
jgi:hypothetical protein